MSILAWLVITFGLLPFSDASCVLPSDPNGEYTRLNATVIALEDAESIRGGTVVMLRCYSGYRVTGGSDVAICLFNDRWLPTFGVCDSTPPPDRQCSGFPCHNNRCIPSAYVCDGHNQCGDNSDEQGCVITPDGCQQFRCSNGQCLPNSFVCDDSDDCGDGSDERNCTCTNGFRCRNNSSCIFQSWVCDGEDDCGDNSDERDCSHTTRLPCRQGQFPCGSGLCIPSEWVCDNENDCRDGSDEQNCPTTTPSTSCPQFSCANGQCVPRIWICDGDNDCGDQSDEQNCSTTTTNPTCSGFSCGNGRCIRSSWVCDGDNDCRDWSDEQNCPTTTRRPCRGFTCRNNRCVRSSWVCDGDNDCGDMSDERNCRDRSCSGFSCDNGKCIPERWICDRDNDCGDGSDERSCPGRQTSTSTPCRGHKCSDGRCIIQGYVCDGKFDCSDRSDEQDCSTTVTGGPLTFQKCGTLSPNQKVFGGSTAMEGQFPWIAKLYSKFQSDSSLYGCGATLINDRWLVTAAHCLAHSTPVQRVKVLLGRLDLDRSTRSEDGVERIATHTVVHPSYSRRNEWMYDIGLIRLETPVTFQKNIRPICLPDSICDTRADYGEAAVDNCTELVVAGWGRTEEENKPSILRTGTMQVQSRNRCNRYYDSTLSDAHICVGRGPINGDPSTCKGDSGGPAMCLRNHRYYSIGVVSWGSGSCGRASAPSVFSRICKALPWINQVTGGN